MGPEPTISVIVPCRDHARALGPCLAVLAQQQIGVAYEVIVVDSAGDPAVTAVAASYAAVRVISSPIPLRPEAARNLGFDNARGDILATIDADCVPAPKWLAAAYAVLQAGATTVGGPVGDALPWHPMAVSDNIMQLADFLPFRADEAAGYLPGGNLALTRKAYEALGHIPYTGDLAGADTLYSQAAISRWSSRVRFVQAMRVNHEGRRTFPALWRHMYSFGYGRASLNVSLKPAYRRLGRYTLMIGPIAARRWPYLAHQIARWHPIGLLRYLLLTPIIAVGLLAWALGFRDGYRQPIYEVALGR